MWIYLDIIGILKENGITEDRQSDSLGSKHLHKDWARNPSKKKQDFVWIRLHPERTTLKNENNLKKNVDNIVKRGFTPDSPGYSSGFITKILIFEPEDKKFIEINCVSFCAIGRKS